MEIELKQRSSASFEYDLTDDETNEAAILAGASVFFRMQAEDGTIIEKQAVPVAETPGRVRLTFSVADTEKAQAYVGEWSIEGGGERSVSPTKGFWSVYVRRSLVPAP